MSGADGWRTVTATVRRPPSTVTGKEARSRQIPSAVGSSGMSEGPPKALKSATRSGSPASGAKRATRTVPSSSRRAPLAIESGRPSAHSATIGLCSMRST